MSEILDLIELGNPILREVAKEVSDLADDQVQKLIDDMLVTVVEANGVGLSAPQVDRSLRIFVMAPSQGQNALNASGIGHQKICGLWLHQVRVGICSCNYPLNDLNVNFS